MRKIIISGRLNKKANKLNPAISPKVWQNLNLRFCRKTQNDTYKVFCTFYQFQSEKHPKMLNLPKLVLILGGVLLCSSFIQTQERVPVYQIGKPTVRNLRNNALENIKCFQITLISNLRNIIQEK